VRGTWYRYAADTEPSKADPVRLAGIDDILAWFANGALLVVGHFELAVARETGGRIVLHRIAAARGYSKAFARDDGTQYVVGADALYAVAPDGNTVRALGAVPCGGDVTDVAPVHGESRAHGRSRRRRPGSSRTFKSSAFRRDRAGSRTSGGCIRSRRSRARCTEANHATERNRRRDGGRGRLHSRMGTLQLRRR
jgi:hypothetical protein